MTRDSTETHTHTEHKQQPTQRRNTAKKLHTRHCCQGPLHHCIQTHNTSRGRLDDNGVRTPHFLHGWPPFLLQQPVIAVNAVSRAQNTGNRPRHPPTRAEHSPEQRSGHAASVRSASSGSLRAVTASAAAANPLPAAHAAPSAPQKLHALTGALLNDVCDGGHRSAQISLIANK